MTRQETVYLGGLALFVVNEHMSSLVLKDLCSISVCWKCWLVELYGCVSVF